MEPKEVRSRMNTAKTVVLLTALTLILIAIGQWLGGSQGAVMALIFAGALNFFSYWFSDKLVLMTYRAQPIERGQAPELFGMVERLTRQAGLPMPKVYIIPGESPNAFATGRDPQHASVAVTEGILRILNRSELEGVLAHELAHVRHRDILIGSIVATVAGAITILARLAHFGAMFGGVGGRDDREGSNPIALLVMAIVAPLAAILIQLAISRSREFAADAGGAQISHNPMALASALGKLERGAQALPMSASPSSAHIFTVSPLSGGGLAKLFSTHPPIAERISRLRAMAGGR
jgi:heat shock protein HtpX